MFLCHDPIYLFIYLFIFLFFFLQSVRHRQLREMKVCSHNVSFLMPISRNIELISRYVMNIPINFI